MSRLIAVALIAVALSAGFMHFCRDAGRVEREQRDAIYRTGESLRDRMIAQSYIVDAFAEADSLVIVPGPRWVEVDPRERAACVANLADHFCHRRTAPVLIRPGKP